MENIYFDWILLLARNCLAQNIWNSHRTKKTLSVDAVKQKRVSSSWWSGGVLWLQTKRERERTSTNIGHVSRGAIEKKLHTKTMASFGVCVYMYKNCQNVIWSQLDFVCASTFGRAAIQVGTCKTKFLRGVRRKWSCRAEGRTTVYGFEGSGSR